MKKTFLLLMLAACSHPKDEVLVIEKTKTYHREDCQKTMMAKTESMPLTVAQQKNIQPCPGCQPDSLTREK